MLIKVGEKRVSIWFKYTRTAKQLQHGGNEVKDVIKIGKEAFSPIPDTIPGSEEFETKCVMEEKLADGSYKLIQEGIAKKHPKDRIQKLVGRRMALSHLLKKLENADKQFKKVIWTEYFKHHKDGKLINTKA